MANHLREQNLGWAKYINMKLNEYQLEPDWEIIKTKSKVEWKRLRVEQATEAMNRTKLTKGCTTETPTGPKINTKTKSIYHKLNTETYTRKPVDELLTRNKQKTKAIILSCHGMLECGANYKGTMKDTCQECNMYDDENHRFKVCSKWNDQNDVNRQTTLEFHNIFSCDSNLLDRVVEGIESVWELKYANGRMKK